MVRVRLRKKKFLRNKSLINATTHTTKVMYIDSLFISYISLKLLKKDEDVPVIDHVFVYSVFTLITENDAFVEFCNECEVDKTMSNNPEDLYSEPHQFFKRLFDLQKEVSKKVYIMEETPLSVASKSYLYRNLKELSSAIMLNRRCFRFLHEQWNYCAALNCLMVT
ncbi:hypothetical protein BDF21DRAFT_399556 [Thamnidium elegans]|nr:hypothetical protein BDF21DRAFT_399556 [Thamnidium elegans]